MQKIRFSELENRNHGAGLVYENNFRALTDRALHNFLDGML
jgi:hypothetical protein